MNAARPVSPAAVTKKLALTSERIRILPSCPTPATAGPEPVAEVSSAEIIGP